MSSDPGRSSPFPCPTSRGIALRDSPPISRPSNRTLPCRMVPLTGSRPMIERDRMVLPEPLSPTIPSALPRSNVSETPSTAPHQTPGRLKCGAHILELEERPVGRPGRGLDDDAHTAASRMSNLRARRSPMKLKLRTVRNRKRQGKIVAHHATFQVVSCGVNDRARSAVGALPARGKPARLRP